MISEEKIKYYLNTFKDLQLSDLLMLFALARKKELQADEVYIKEGALHNKLAYITKGLIRTYAIKENGEEATVQLHWEDQFFASRDNVILQKPSRFIFQAMEPTILLEVDYQEMQALLDANPQFAYARNFFLLQMLETSMERLEAFILQSPEERYRQLLHERPDIISRVPLKNIATLLGITPVSLSRLRKRMATKGRH